MVGQDSLDMEALPMPSVGPDPVSENSGSSYRPFDEILMEGASCGSVRALAVGVCEAAFVANGIVRSSSASRDAKVSGIHDKRVSAYILNAIITG